jgi:hypothetical protein
VVGRLTDETVWRGSHNSEGSLRTAWYLNGYFKTWCVTKHAALYRSCYKVVQNHHFFIIFHNENFLRRTVGIDILGGNLAPFLSQKPKRETTKWNILHSGLGYFFIIVVISLVGIATGYGVNDQGGRVRVLVWSRIFSSPHRQDRLWSSPKSYRMGTKGSFSGSKAVGAWSLPFTSK